MSRAHLKGIAETIPVSALKAFRFPMSPLFIISGICVLAALAMPIAFSLFGVGHRDA
jgi:hypothetical protein